MLSSRILSFNTPSENCIELSAENVNYYFHFLLSQASTSDQRRDSGMRSDGWQLKSLVVVIVLPFVIAVIVIVIEFCQTNIEL